MHNRYAAAIPYRPPWWIGWIEEIPGVNCQGPGREVLLDSLRGTVREAVERNRGQLLEAGPGYTKECSAV